MEINIGEKKVGNNYPTYFVAEIGVNHCGDVNLAKKMILAAKKSVLIESFCHILINKFRNAKTVFCIHLECVMNIVRAGIYMVILSEFIFSGNNFF